MTTSAQRNLEATDPRLLFDNPNTLDAASVRYRVRDSGKEIRNRFQFCKKGDKYEADTTAP
jgi:hypothetical protein